MPGRAASPAKPRAKSPKKAPAPAKAPKSPAKTSKAPAPSIAPAYLFFGAVAAFSFLAGSYIVTGSSSGSTIDGLAFPGTFGGGNLLGGGLRSKYGVVKVYSVGVYAEKVPSKMDGLISGSMKKALLLRFHRGVGADAVAGALKDALVPRLGAKGASSFKDALDKAMGGDVAKGDSLSFACKGSSMSISLNGGGGASLSGKACESLFDVYLGKDPISKEAKQGVAAAFG